MIEKQIVDAVEQIKEELFVLSKNIFDHPELGNEEFYSSRQHIDYLSKHGFDVVEKYLGTETGFRATYRSAKAGPTIAYMCEYDALPGIGHGCGHNMLGTTSTAAGIALSKVVDQIGGTVVVLGTPAEETSGAKVIYADKGGFDDIDVALIAHPNQSFNRSGTSLALEAIQFEFFGKTSHAASAPEKGINALDAVINTFNTINALRQQVTDDARIHGIINDGGKAANVIPDYCCAQFYVRAAKKEILIDLVERVKNCAKGAALASGTELKISNYEYSYDDLITNHVLDDLFFEKLVQLGLAPEKINCAREFYGSIDTGNVSRVCPAIHPYFDITNDLSIAAHTIEFANATLTDYAKSNMLLTVKALALTGAAVIEDPEILKAINEEFKTSIPSK